MRYYDMVEHMRNHYRKNQYRCDRPGCNHKAYYESADDLATLHWKQSCRGFWEIYKLCADCGVQKRSNQPHGAHICIENIRSDLAELDAQLEYQQEK